MGCLQGSCSAIELRQQNGLPGAQTPGPLISRNFTREGAAVFSRSLPGIRDPLGGVPRRERKKPWIRGRGFPGTPWAATGATSAGAESHRGRPGSREPGQKPHRGGEPPGRPGQNGGSRGGKAGGWGGFAGESRAESHTGAEKTPGSRDCAGRKTGFSGADGGKKGGHRGRKPGVWGKNGDSGGCKAFGV